MNHRILLFFIASATALGPSSGPAHGDTTQLSPERLDELDKRGFFTPDFKTAVHDFVNARHNLAQANADQKELKLDLPDLQTRASEVEAKEAALRHELDKYEHPDEADYLVLQNLMNDSSAKPVDQMALAQAYVWTYPSSPHQADAQEYLRMIQKSLADQKQAEKDANAARVAAHAALVKRAQAHDLSMAEWRDLLRDMSQDDLLKLMGRPSLIAPDYWIYSGGWALDPTTSQKVGMVVNFNAGRVISVSEKAPPP